MAEPMQLCNYYSNVCRLCAVVGLRLTTAIEQQVVKIQCVLCLLCMRGGEMRAVVEAIYSGPGAIIQFVRLLLYQSIHLTQCLAINPAIVS